MVNEKQSILDKIAKEIKEKENELKQKVDQKTQEYIE